MARNVRWGLLLLATGLLQAGCRWSDYDGISTSDGGVGQGGGGGGWWDGRGK